MIEKVTHLHHHPEFKRGRNKPFLRYINTAAIMPNKTAFFVQSFLGSGAVDVKPGLAEVADELIKSSPQRQFPCRVDIHGLQRPAIDDVFASELGKDHELMFWMLAHFITEQMEGEEGWLPTDARKAIMFGDGRVYTAEWEKSRWALNAHYRRTIKWDEDTIVLGLNSKIHHH